MNISEILNELNKASLFELYRLNQAIRRQLEEPKRINIIKDQLKVGQVISYFNTDENRLVEAVIMELKRTKVLVKNKHDGWLWNIPFYYINIDNLDTDINSVTKRRVDRNILKVGDKVCFKDKKGFELFGEVIKLNQKTAGILVGKIKWRVAYSLLSPIIDGELGNDKNLLEGEVLSIETGIPNNFK
jgi:hypothetical protein